MPTKLDFKSVEKYCENCGRKVRLNNNRDIERKKFCSRRCCTLFYLNTGVVGMKGKNHSEEAILKMSKKAMGRVPWNLGYGDYIRGDKAPNWQGGKTPITRSRTNRPTWRRLAKSIIERDNNECQICGEVENLSVHHKIPWEVSQDDSPENLVTVCRSCHSKLEWRWLKSHPV